MTGVLRDDMPPVRLMHAADGIALAEVSNVFVAIWRAPASRALFDWQRFCMAECVQRHPKGTAFLCVIEPTSKPPDDELRRASAEMIGEHQDRLRCVGVVIEGEGFRAAITRGVLSGMVLLLPNRKVPVSYLSSVAEAAGWMGGHFPIPSPQSFGVGVGRVRAQLSAWSNAQR
jgi:hypothetical protein